MALRVEVSFAGLDGRDLPDLADLAAAAGEEIYQVARANARQRLGGGKFGERIAKSVTLDLKDDGTGEVWSGGAEGFIGEHVHRGGPIKSRSGKPLAIPLPTAATARYNPRRLFARELKDDLIKIRSRRGVDLLFRKPDKGQPLESPLFVLKDATRPQAARPWWPDDAEISTAAEHGIEKHLGENEK